MLLGIKNLTQCGQSTVGYSHPYLNSLRHLFFHHYSIRESLKIAYVHWRWCLRSSDRFLVCYLLLLQYAPEIHLLLYELGLCLFYGFLQLKYILRYFDNLLYSVLWALAEDFNIPSSQCKIHSKTWKNSKI